MRSDAVHRQPPDPGIADACQRRSTGHAGIAAFLPGSWTSKRARLERAGVPAEYRTARTKPEMALAEIDRTAADQGQGSATSARGRGLAHRRTQDVGREEILSRQPVLCSATNRWGVHARLLVEAQRLDPRRQAEAVETHAGFAGRASHHVVDQERADVAAFGIDRETCRWARSAITACKRSYWPCTLWYSTITFSPLV